VSDLAVSAPRGGVTPFPASFHTQMVPTNGTSLCVRVGGKGPRGAVACFGLRVIVAPWHCSGQGPYCIGPTCAAWVCFRGGPPRNRGLHQEEPGGRHCRVMDATQVQNADLVTHESATWSAMRWPLNIRTGHALGGDRCTAARDRDGTPSFAARCCGTSISEVLTRSVSYRAGAHLPRSLLERVVRRPQEDR